MIDSRKVSLRHPLAHWEVSLRDHEVTLGSNAETPTSMSSLSGVSLSLSILRSGLTRPGDG